jgi:hypothetical protein
VKPGFQEGALGAVGGQGGRLPVGGGRLAGPAQPVIAASTSAVTG